MDHLVSDKRWTVVKFDIDKFIKPKEWGWRFIGADIQMANGLLVECYVVFKGVFPISDTCGFFVSFTWACRAFACRTYECLCGIADSTL
jgi:hypothetical protein